MPSETLSLPTPDGPADAFVAYPDDAERPHPGVLLYPDAFGPRPELRERARVLAGHGYYVLVPNFLYRHGPAPVIELPEHIGEELRGTLIGRLMPWIQEHTAERVVRDAESYLDFLTGRPEVSDGPVGVLGYCVGAALALRTAAARPEQVAAVAGFHPGFLVTDAADSPHRLVHRLRAGAGAHFGLAEGDLSPEAASELSQALETAGTEHSVELYPGTVHGFTMSDTDAFDSAALQRHWDRLLPLLERNLGDSAASARTSH